MVDDVCKVTGYIADRRAALLRDIDAGLEDIEAGRVYDGEEVFAELLGEEEPRP